MWRVNQRRLATCQSWLLDAQLTDFLIRRATSCSFSAVSISSTTVRQRRRDHRFIFQKSGSVADLPRDTSLQRGVLDLLERGPLARAPGWMDFDGN